MGVGGTSACGKAAARRTRYVMKIFNEYDAVGRSRGYVLQQRCVTNYMLCVWQVREAYMPQDCANGPRVYADIFIACAANP